LAYAALVGGAFVWLFGEASWLVGLSIVGRGPVFLCGIAAAWVYARFGARLRTWRPLARMGDVMLVAAVIALEMLLRMVASGGFLSWETAPWVTWHIVEGFLWAVVVLLVLVAPLRLRVLFVNSTMMRLGVLSYSIYLLHWPLLLWAGRFVQSPLMLATGGSGFPETYVVAAASVALSALTYRFIERPFLIWKARVGDTRWQEAAARKAA
jgi:peptidoglycan/LPS O-acetylase OafA/YrhL